VESWKCGFHTNVRRENRLQRRTSRVSLSRKVKDYGNLRDPSRGAGSAPGCFDGTNGAQT